MKLAAGTLFIVLLLFASLESLQFPLEVFIEEIAPISKPDILIAVPLPDAVNEVPVICPVAESPVATIDPALIVPSEMLPGWSFVRPVPAPIIAETVHVPAFIVALLDMSAVPVTI